MTRARRPAPLRVAVVGKGGSGKSLIAGTLARLLARRGHRVLALDSDPLPGLAISIGIEVGDEAMLEGYAERHESGEWRIVRDLKPVTVVRRTAREGPDGVLFLQFGKVDTPSLAPLMSSLQAFWGVTRELSSGPWTIVHDLPAGTRQAFSGWAGSADGFLIVVEPTQKSILSAGRLAGVTQLAGQARLGLVANKVRSGSDPEMIADALPGVELVASVPFDPIAAAAERDGIAPIDHDPGSPGVRALETFAGQLESWLRKEAS